MTGDEEGQWMLVHSNVGSSANNMGNESHFKWLKDACNSRKNISLNHFLGMFLAYLQDYCSVEYGKIVSLLSLADVELRSVEGQQGMLTVTVLMRRGRIRRKS